jgi:hypothetical protein
MGNHFHFLVKVKCVDEALLQRIQQEKTVAARKLIRTEIDFNTFLVDQFKRFFTAYARKFNDQQKRHGSVFQTRFKRTRVLEGFPLLDKICYIHHNPIHHDFHAVYQDWKYSSYDVYLGYQPTWLERKKGLVLFGAGGKRELFTDYHLHFKQNWKKRKCKDDDM